MRIVEIKDCVVEKRNGREKAKYQRDRSQEISRQRHRQTDIR